MNNTEKQILTAIKKGVPVSVIAKHTGVSERTLRWRISNIREYKLAREQYFAFLENLFSVDN